LNLPFALIAQRPYLPYADSDKIQKSSSKFGSIYPKFQFPSRRQWIALTQLRCEVYQRAKANQPRFYPNRIVANEKLSVQPNQITLNAKTPDEKNVKKVYWGRSTTNHISRRILPLPARPILDISPLHNSNVSFRV